MEAGARDTLPPAASLSRGAVPFLEAGARDATWPGRVIEPRGTTDGRPAGQIPTLG